MKQTPLIPLDLLPLGFRFHPTDEELINHYLKNKIAGRIKAADAAVIPEIDVCRFEPWDLPDKSAIRSTDPEWFFFAAVDRKYPTGSRSNRATEAGYWKATGKDRSIRSRQRGGSGTVVVGMKKTLVFHRGRAPRGARTNWIMHEYRAVEPEFEAGGDGGCFVLFKLMRKPEETISSMINEPEKSALTPISAKSSPGSSQHKADDEGEEFSAQLNQQSPESNLHEELQPLPHTIHKQSADSSLTDGVHLTPYIMNPEESHCINNLTSHAAHQGAEIAGEEGALYDDLAQFLGPEYDHLLSEEFYEPKAPLLPSEDDLILHFQGAQNHFQPQKFEDSSVVEMLDAMLSIPEVCSDDVSNSPTDSASMVVSEGRKSAINQTSEWNSVMHTQFFRGVDSDDITQGGLGFEASVSSRMGTPSRYVDINPSMVLQCNSKQRSIPELETTESRLLLGTCAKTDENLGGPANLAETKINTRHRTLENLTTSFDSSGAQGMAERRIRLQSSNPLEQTSKNVRGLRRRCNTFNYVASTGIAKPGKHDEDQISENIKAPEPGNLEESSDDVCEKTTLKLRTRQTDGPVAEMVGAILHQETVETHPIPIRRIGVAVFIVSLIFAGTIWLLRS